MISSFYENKKEINKQLEAIYSQILPGNCKGCANCCSESVGASFTEAANIYVYLLKLRTKIKTMNLENSIIDRLIICFRHIKQAFPLKLLAKPLKMLLKNCQFAHWMLI